MAGRCLPDSKIPRRREEEDKESAGRGGMHVGTRREAGSLHSIAGVSVPH